MSARHESPLREYLQRADDLRKDLRSADPATVQAAVDRCAVLPHLTEALQSGSLAPHDVRRQLTLDVIAHESGYRAGWRQLTERLFFLFPISSPEWERGKAAAHRKQEENLHDELVEAAASYAFGWSDLHVNLDQPWDEEAPPKPLPLLLGSGASFTPDVTGIHEGRVRIVEVMREEEFRGAEALPKLRAFSAAAKALDGHLVIFVDGWGAYVASSYVRKHGLEAEVVEWSGQYQYEYLDALEADGWRDVD